MSTDIIGGIRGPVTTGLVVTLLIVCTKTGYTFFTFGCAEPPEQFQAVGEWWRERGIDAAVFESVDDKKHELLEFLAKSDQRFS